MTLYGTTMSRKAVVGISLLLALAFVLVAAGDGGVVSANESVEVTDASLDEETIDVGDSVEVTATIENDGNESWTGTVDLEVDGDTESTQLVSVDGGESETVSFEPSFDDDGEYDISVEGESAGTLTVEDDDEAEFVVSDADLSNETVDPGESAEASATVENEGDADGTETVELRVDGEVDATQSVSLDAGESETVTFDRTFQDAGEYEIAIANETAGTLTVEEREPEFLLEEAELSEEAILVENETVEVMATVTNEGNGEGTYTAELVIDGDVEDTEELDLEAGETDTVTFERTFDEAGEYAILVGDEAAGTLSVERPGSVELVDAAVSSDWVRAGYSTTVQVAVENPGDRPADRNLTVTVDDSTVTEETVRAEPGEQTIDLEFEAVEGTVAVEGVEAGSIVVGEDDGNGGDDGEADDDADGLPGFTIGLAVVALLVAVTIARAHAGVGRRR